MTRLVCKMPALFMLLIILLATAAFVVPVLYAPTINTSFETLTVQDQPVNEAVAASAHLTTGSSDFWGLSSASREDDADGDAPARRRLAQAEARPADEPLRDFVRYTLHVVFHNNDLTTMLTRGTVARIKEVEDRVYELPEYTRLCLHRSVTGTVRECRRPVSVTNFVYGTTEADGSFTPDGNSDVQQDPVKTAQVRVPSSMRAVLPGSGDTSLLVPLGQYCCISLSLSLSVSLRRRWRI